MKGLGKILMWTGVLVLAYLLLLNGKSAANLINATAAAYSGSVRTLQGR